MPGGLIINDWLCSTRTGNQGGRCGIDQCNCAHINLQLSALASLLPQTFLCPAFDKSDNADEWLACTKMKYHFNFTLFEINLKKKRILYGSWGARISPAPPHFKLLIAKLTRSVIRNFQRVAQVFDEFQITQIAVFPPSSLRGLSRASRWSPTRERISRYITSVRFYDPRRALPGEAQSIIFAASNTLPYMYTRTLADLPLLLTHCCKLAKISL